MSNRRYNNNRQPVISAKDVTKTNFSDKAEEVIRSYGGSAKVTTSQIRPMLSRINELVQNSRKNSGILTDEEISGLQYLKTTIVYSSGREFSTKDFVIKANLLEFVNRILESKNRDDLELFGKYFESLVAFHKYLGGE
ncbi:MAG: type III-A CRISPR-associated protein Csm2 [Tissierellia bacterium]|nr:type III-A CRISPR-associated protein Csm2 [Tissierellia bacterium]